MAVTVEKKQRIQKAILAIISLMLVMVGIAFLVWMMTKSSSAAERIELSEGWSAWINGEKLAEKDAITDYEFKNLSIGDEVTFQCKLPEDLPTRQTVTFLCYLSTVDAYMDDSLIYSYGHEYAEQSWLVGSGYHFIDLPEEAAGRMLTVTFTAQEPDAFTSLTTPTSTATSEVYRDFARQHLLGLFVGGFLVLLGVLMSLVSVVAVCYSRVYVRLLYIGIFSLLMGLWSMCNLKVLQIFNVNLADNSTVEYLTLYLAPIAFVLMIAELRKEDELWKRQIVNAVATLLILFFVVATMLHFLNIEHYPRLLRYFHLFGAISLVLVVATGYRRKGKKRDRSGQAMHIGVVCLCISVALDLLRFNLQKYVFPQNELLTVSVIPLGTLLFILALVVSYIFYVYGILVDEAENAWLTQRAYHDELCGTYNRTKCNEVFDALDQSKEEYALVNLDLNGLKATNDSLGHAQGDLLLQEFAEILQTAFRDVGEVFRMGGDEFLVYIREEGFAQIDPSIGRMVRLEKRRSSDLPFTIEAAYGVAKSSECPNESVTKVYMLADQRMYEMKTKQKINKRLH